MFHNRDNQKRKRGHLMLVQHNIQPIYNHNSKILILGSFPSVKSREAQFFYHHPQNHHEPLLTIEDKKDFLLKHHIALWDVIQSCDIQGSSDSSIQNVKVNDITLLLKQTHIQYIYTNGKKAHQLYSQYGYPITGIKDICLPSTSPANAAYSLERLLDSWKIICQEEGKEVL